MHIAGDMKEIVDGVATPMHSGFQDWQDHTEWSRATPQMTGLDYTFWLALLFSGLDIPGVAANSAHPPENIS